MLTLNCDFCGKEIKLTEIKSEPENWEWHAWINRNGCQFEYRPTTDRKHICEECALQKIKEEAKKLK